ncbi:tetratricopeptide repeat protein [Allokutzneria multivorans]|uniref:tetratricopeptide repeat protein n=1 Tax=Allokutzneria multivorans TaxID=1142134 RepID=UPI0031EF2ADB
MNRIQHFPQRHLWYLCHAVAEVVEHHLPEETLIEVCHLAEADETDRLLVQALVERARFRLRPPPVRVVRGNHVEPGTEAPLDEAALLDAVRLGYYETAELCGRVLVDEADWPEDYDADFHALLHAHTVTLIAVGRPIESVWYSRIAARRWGGPALRASAHHGQAMFHSHFGGPADLDLDRAARSWGKAMTAAASIAEPELRARRTAFYENSLALAHRKNGDLATALSRIDAGLAVLDRGGQEALQHWMVLRGNRAAVLTLLGRADEALADLDHAVACDPANAQPLVDRATAFRAVGRTEEALRDLTHAIDHCVCGPEAYVNRASLLLAAGELDAALEDLRLARLLDDSCDATLVQFAEVLIDAELFAEAADLLHEWTGHDPSATVWALRARLAVAGGAAGHALATVDAGLVRHPASDVLRTERAAVLHLLRRPAEALAELDHVCAGGEGDPVVEANRVLLLVECGRQHEALARARRLLRREVSDEIRSYVRDVLAGVGHPVPTAEAADLGPVL